MMHFPEIAQLIGEAAPMIASTIVGPYGAVAVSLLGKAIGIPASEPGAIVDALKSDPGSFVDKLKELESNHGSWLSMLNNMKMPSKISVSLEVEFPV